MLNYVLDAKKRGVDVSKHLYGLFFEDINQAADGGLNAEMVINNSFEFAYFTYDDFNGECDVEVRHQKNFYWDIFGAGPKKISKKGGMNENNPSYLLLDVGGIYHLENPGYYLNGGYDMYGMPVEKDETYNFSMYIKRLGFKGVAEIFIRGAHGRHTTVGEIKIPEGTDGDWIKVTTSVKAEKDFMGRLCINLEGNGKLGIDYVSLLPSKTWGDPNKYRNGKLSPRIVEALKNCHPTFFRFPGGCVVEGDVAFDYLYKWRNTVGPLEQRKQIPNLWRYMQSYGVGFYEYFALCEDLNMTPLPVLHCGLLCQVRMGETRKTGYKRIMPGTEQFQKEVIDNVADLIYFAKGDISSSDKNEAYWAKVFMGEYGTHTMADGRGRLNGDNNLKTALSEAVFLTGCERNSDVVKMTCYAPLFASTVNYRWTPNLIWFNARDVMLTPNYYVQQMFAKNKGDYTLTDVSPVNDDNAGGLLIGGHRTANAVSYVKVTDRASGKQLYFHDFKDGLGAWKVYPNCRGGHLENGRLIIEESDAFNGYYYDAQAFSDCDVEIGFQRLSGEQSFIAGVGVADVRDAGTMDSAGFSICCQYGKNHKGYDVSFDKRVDFIRTVCEMMGKDKFLGYSSDGNKLRLEYTKNTFRALIYKDGDWHEVLFKNIWKVNERVFQSTTVGNDGKIYLKVVNVSGKDEELCAKLVNFPNKTTAHVTTLWNEDETAINEIGAKEGKKMNLVPTESTVKLQGDTLKAVLKNNSVNVFVIE